jgi:hypothetical protein
LAAEQPGIRTGPPRRPTCGLRQRRRLVVAEQSKRLTVGEAAELIRQTLGIPRGPAFSILIDARASGEVQTFGDSGRDWWKIDPEAGFVTDVSGLYRMNVGIDGDDLAFWLERNLDWLNQEYLPAAARDRAGDRPQTAPSGEEPARKPRVDSQARKGRPAGSGGIDDAEGLQKMIALLKNGDARSMHAAAAKVAAAKRIGQSEEADRARLRHKFANTYGSKAKGQTWPEFLKGIEGKINARN